MFRRRWIGFVFLFLAFVVTSCVPEQAGRATQVPVATPTPAPLPSPTAASGSDEVVADEIVRALKDKDLVALSAFVHPVKGVRFSPYAFVLESDLVFTPGQLAGLLQDKTVYTWGRHDGTGLPIEMTFQEYDRRFVYSHDFANAEKIGYNQVIGRGNTPDNIAEFYPGSVFVEYHFPGFDPKYEGLDWVGLRLVFQEENGTWYLVGVVHAEWTI